MYDSKTLRKYQAPEFWHAAIRSDVTEGMYDCHALTAIPAVNTVLVIKFRVYRAQLLADIAILGYIELYISET